MSQGESLIAGRRPFLLHSSTFEPFGNGMVAQHTKPFEIGVMDHSGGTRTLEFCTEKETVAYLSATHGSEAVLWFTHTDGTAVAQELMNRIHRAVFANIRSVDTILGSVGLFEWAAPGPRRT